MIRELENELEDQTILIFRKVAHLRVERAKRTAIVASTPASVSTTSAAWNSLSSWSSWLWGTTKAQPEREESEDDGAFTDEDWEKLTSAVEFEEEEAVDDTPYTVKLFFSFHLQSASLSLLDSNKISFMNGNLTDCSASYCLYPKTQSFSFEVSEAVLSGEDGVLMTTVHQSRDERVYSAISMEYTLLPQDASVAARIKLMTSSTYMLFKADAFLALKQFLAPTEQVDVSVLEAQAVAHIKKVSNVTL